MKQTFRCVDRGCVRMMLWSAPPEIPCRIKQWHSCAADNHCGPPAVDAAPFYDSVIPEDSGAYWEYFGSHTIIRIVVTADRATVGRDDGRARRRRPTLE